MLLKGVGLVKRTTSWLGLILASALLAWSSFSLAEKVEGIYSASALVADTSAEQRDAAANQMLLEVLVRASGTERVLVHQAPADFMEDPEVYAEHPKFALWRSLTQASNLISQYSYSNTNQILRLEQGQTVTAQLLELTFDELGVKRLLQGLHAPIWDANRPKVLIWLALDSRNGQNLISPDTNAPLSKVLQDQSALRGLPYSFPSLSSSNNMFSYVWNLDEEMIVRRSLAYQADAILIGKVQSRGEEWGVSWNMFLGAQSVDYSTTTAKLGEALVVGIDFATEELAQRYASQAGQGAGTYTLVISEVNKVQDYAALNNYLQGLSLTKGLRLVESSAEGLVYELQLSGGLDQLRANLSLDGRLQEEGFIGLPNAPLADAYFRWQTN